MGQPSIYVDKNERGRIYTDHSLVMFCAARQHPSTGCTPCEHLCKGDVHVNIKGSVAICSRCGKTYAVEISG